jgi:serine/threonine protein kinase
VNSDIRVGPYRILRLINRGGQGSVYLGYDGRLRRRVAIKIYRLPQRPAARRALFREAQTVASLDSPRIVSVYDIIESPGHLALVMEYVPGCDLREFLASVRPSLASVVTIATDLAAALAVARQQRLVHGDLKAANVLITDGGRAKLTDFGIARKGTESKVAGSLSALSPEQYLGEPLDVRSDLFALGCLVYRMLGGEEPFRKSGQLDVRWLLERPPPPLGELVPPEMDVPRELLELVMQMLRRDPGERPANTHRVRRVLREVPLFSPGVSRGYPTGCTRRPGAGQPLAYGPRRTVVIACPVVLAAAPVGTAVLSRAGCHARGDSPAGSRDAGSH